MPEKMDYIVIGLGVLAAVLVSSYVPSLVSVSSMGSSPYSIQRTDSKMITLENISGIDLNSLSIVRQKNLM